MKDLFLLLTAILFFSSCSEVHFFEGEIIYKSTVKSKVEQMTDKEALKIFGSGMHYFIKNGNTKWVTDGILDWQIYLNKDNKSYSKIKDSSNVHWSDASFTLDQVLKTETRKNAETILGYACDEIIITCKSGTYTYYYSPKLAVNTELFANSEAYHWHYYLKLTNSLPLKIIIDAPSYKVINEAVEVNEKPLEDILFNLPAGIKLIKDK